MEVDLSWEKHGLFKIEIIMTFGVGKTAFTEVRAHSEARVKETKEKLDKDLDTLRKTSVEAISTLQIEIGTLQRKIAVLEGTLGKERITKQESIAAFRLEVDIEKKKRKQAERERDFLLAVFQRRKPESDRLPEDVEGYMSPCSREMYGRNIKEEYDSWEQDWQDYLKIRK